MVITTNKINNISNLKLSIQVSLSGLSFCILNIETNTITYLKPFGFNKNLNPNQVLDKLKHYFNTEPNLKKVFSEVIVIHKNELSTLVPKALFNEDNLADYLKFNNKILSTDYITFDEIVFNESINVYVPFTNINNYLFDEFGEFTFKHFSTILIEQILNAEKNADQPKMYVNVNSDYFEVVVVEKGKLKFYNTFEYYTKEDFIYYVLFTAEQIGLNPESFELIFTGNIDSKDKLYSIAYKYVRYVSFSKKLDNFKYKNNDKPEINHNNFIILNSF